MVRPRRCRCSATVNTLAAYRPTRVAVRAATRRRPEIPGISPPWPEVPGRSAPWPEIPFSGLLGKPDRPVGRQENEPRRVRASCPVLLPRWRPRRSRRAANASRRVARRRIFSPRKSGTRGLLKVVLRTDSRVTLILKFYSKWRGGGDGWEEEKTNF